MGEQLVFDFFRTTRNTDVALKALHAVEWSISSWGARFCPLCQMAKRVGHRESCPISQAIATLESGCKQSQ